MKRRLAALLLMLPVFAVAQKHQQKVDVQLTPWHNNGALVQLPDDYDAGNNRYPLILFLHGKSKSGTNISKLALEGIPYWLDKGAKLDAVNPVDGKQYKFIIVCPQALEWGLTPVQVNFVLDQVIKRYRVDTSRIYLTGYSAGGWATIMAITENAAITKRFAAAVPMSPSAIDPPNEKRFKLVADAGVHCWYFGGEEEITFLENSQRYTDSTNKYGPGLARTTVTPYRHCCWKDLYDPAFRQEGMNIYEWMLQYRKEP
ncbi:prolyl oligopeptidase family serine peptidase [Chitinophaga horti]|uniref:Prolyl oligopeptidase family serine peptidase n=1 Tax=Chitinophaga horti TaxID=2920382 RepID=A0ABY6J6X7_9BACT|nr:prolyl oligopeptidase family serine peptidase [Chitinophaga horti]UYQ95245.1 prolyl oligopeptidase family serine peptidase [Chitinophaga horti]